MWSSQQQHGGFPMMYTVGAPAPVVHQNSGHAFASAASHNSVPHQYTPVPTSAVAVSRFTDIDFPPEAASLSSKPVHVEWRRISDMYPDMMGTSLFKHDRVHEAHPTPMPDDVMQGDNVGDCWLLSAISALARNPNSIRKIFQNSDVFSREGQYTLSLHKDGRARQVIVDDYLPFVKSPFGGAARMYGVNAARSGRLWVALLEKAFAKIHGTYECLNAGNIDDATTDLTGNPTISLDHFLDPKLPHDELDRLFNQLKAQATDKNNVFTAGCDRQLLSDPNVSQMCENGILLDHAYSVEDFAEHDGVRLVRLRNPWGKYEYRGKYSDYDNQWTPALEKDFHVTTHNTNDGRFSMPLDVFRQTFNKMGFCLCRPDLTAVRQELSLGRSNDGHLVAPSIFLRFPDTAKHDDLVGDEAKVGGLTVSESDPAGHQAILAVHQMDKRVSDAKPYVDIGALIFEHDSQSPHAILDSKLRRVSQQCFRFRPGVTYRVVPVTSGVLFQGGDDRERKFMFSAHFPDHAKAETDQGITPPGGFGLAMAPHETHPTPNHVRNAFASMLSSPLATENDSGDYGVRMLGSGALVTIGVNSHAQDPTSVPGGMLALYADGSGSTKIKPTMLSWLQAQPQGFLMPPQKTLALVAQYVREGNDAFALKFSVSPCHATLVDDKGQEATHTSKGVHHAVDKSDNAQTTWHHSARAVPRPGSTTFDGSASLGRGRG